MMLEAIQQALYTRLSGDSALMDVVGGVYDAVPQEAALPYVVIGDGAVELRPEPAGALHSANLALHVWTKGGGRKTALAILQRLHVLLHHGPLTVAGATLLQMEVPRAETQVDAEQDRVYGVLELSLLLRSA